jgi:hypothetical protein
MDLEGLLHVETDMRQQNERIDKHLASLRAQSVRLGIQRGVAEKEYSKLLSGRDWEARQKSLKDQELGAARVALSKRQEEITKVKQHTDILRSEIREYEEKLQELHANKSLADETYSHPSIVHVMEIGAKELGPVPRQILNKTVLALLYPTVLTGVERAQSLQNKMRAAAPHEALASTLVIYACMLLMTYLLYRAYRGIAGRLSLARMVFGTDLCCGGFWALVVVCSACVSDDPLALLRGRLERTLVCTQVLLGGVYCCLVSMRCFLLAASLQGGEAWELFITICVVQDFYQNLWKPSLTDAVLTSGTSNYCWYVLTHLFLSARRARQMVLGDLHGERGSRGKGAGYAALWHKGVDGATLASFASRLAGYARHAGALLQALVVCMTPSAAATCGEDEEQDAEEDAEEDEEEEDDEYMSSRADSESRVLYCGDSYYSSLHGR